MIWSPVVLSEKEPATLDIVPILAVGVGPGLTTTTVPAAKPPAGAVHAVTPSPVRKTLVAFQPLSVKLITAPPAIFARATKAN